MKRQALPAGIQVFERGWLSSNNILLCDSEAAILVDTGYLSHAEQTLALVQSTLGQRPLELILNTHLHSDHCGGNALLHQHYGAEVWVPDSDFTAVRDWDEEQLSFRATGQQCNPFIAHASLSDGQQIRAGGLDWQVIHAPGHDPHSMILYAPQEALLISADALWEHGFGVIFPELEGASGFAEQRAILERIAELEVRLVIPGHGAPFSDVAGALQRAHSRLDYLADDPLRNARNALKVLLAFLLLEQRSFTLDQAAQMLQQSRYMQLAADLLAAPHEEILQQLAAELVRAGAATLEQRRLISAR